MRLLLIIVLLFCGVESFANDSSAGVLFEQGYITDLDNSNVDNPEYSSFGLYYLTARNLRIDMRYMNLADKYSDMYGVSMTQLISLNRKGLYYSAGAEVMELVHKSRGYPGVSRFTPILGLGVFLTRRDFLSQVELSVRYPRVVLNFSVGY